MGIYVIKYMIVLFPQFVALFLLGFFYLLKVCFYFVPILYVMGFWSSVVRSLCTESNLTFYIKS